MTRRFPKGGRPRIADAIRTDNGRIANRTAEGKRREAENKAVAVSARMRMHDVTKEQANMPENGFALGRLWLAGYLGSGDLAEQRLEAGKRMADDYARYHGLSGIPFPSARAQDLFAVHGYTGEMTEAKANELRKATSRKTAIITRLSMMGHNGRRYLSVAEGVCVADLDGCENMELLNGALDELVLLYGLSGAKRERAA